ncbi:MAG: hypothetical protein JW712_11795, partial [Dehalococcoidales bacterium]|nr:hypothetical protein [Dehalococcoidales bacterium]
MTEQSVCIIAEDLSEPIDEGIKHFARSLIEGCRENCKVLGISTHSEGRISIPNTTSIRANKAFVNFKLRSAIRRFHPDVICYVPSASATIFSFLRSRILKLFHPDTRVIMVSLQPRDYHRVSRSLIRLLSPDMIFVQNPAILNKLKNFGCHVTLLPSGVDLNKFTPVSREQKTELRAKYHLDPEAFTVLHVGHSTAGRNIEFLGRVRQEC